HRGASRALKCCRLHSNSRAPRGPPLRRCGARFCCTGRGDPADNTRDSCFPVAGRSADCRQGPTHAIFAVHSRLRVAGPARLRPDYCLDVPSTLWVARQTAEALAALHRARFVHGDVKPDNVRLVADGTAVLIDLGFTHRPGENDALLRDGYVLGTANYLAPELCRPRPHGDSASDLFSLGV